MRIRWLSPSRSNLGSGSHLVTSRSSLTLDAICSMYRAPITRVRGTPSAAAGYRRRSIKSAMPLVALELQRLQASASSRKFRSASLPMTKVLSGGESWWFRQTNHHGLTRQTLRRHVGFRAEKVYFTP
jgi:hypothetical protein